MATNISINLYASVKIETPDMFQPFFDTFHRIRPGVNVTWKVLLLPHVTCDVVWHRAICPTTLL